MTKPALSTAAHLARRVGGERSVDVSEAAGDLGGEVVAEKLGDGGHYAARSEALALADSAAPMTASSRPTMGMLAPLGLGLRSLSFHRLKVVG